MFLKTRSSVSFKFSSEAAFFKTFSKSSPGKIKIPAVHAAAQFVGDAPYHAVQFRPFLFLPVIHLPPPNRKNFTYAGIFP